MMKNLTLAVLPFFCVLGASNARAADAADAADRIVSESTGTAKRTVSDLYRGDRYRDPFVELSPGESTAVREDRKFSLETFSIHALKLKGIMKEKNATYAILVEQETGMGFMLIKRRLYTYKNEKIPGVSGRINAAQKSVTLITAEKDVQTFRLGEDEEGAGKEAEE